MKSLLLFLFLAIFCAQCFGQTPDIYLKKLGLASNFKTKNWVDSDLGMAPEPWVRNSKLVKVSVLNDSTAVMETEMSCHRLNRPENEHRWKAGKDTVLHHPLFNKQNDEDKVRRILKEEYFFDNEMDSVKLVGFPSKSETPSSAQLAEKPERPTKEINSEGKAGKYFLLIIFLTTTAGLIKWR